MHTFAHSSFCSFIFVLMLSLTGKASSNNDVIMIHLFIVLSLCWHPQGAFSSTVRPGAASTDHHHQLRFTITHFEGEVCYEALGFATTNRDRLAPHLRGLLAACVGMCVWWWWWWWWW